MEFIERKKNTRARLLTRIGDFHLRQHNHFYTECWNGCSFLETKKKCFFFWRKKIISFRFDYTYGIENRCVYIAKWARMRVLLSRLSLVFTPSALLWILFFFLHSLNKIGIFVDFMLNEVDCPGIRLLGIQILDEPFRNIFYIAKSYYWLRIATNELHYESAQYNYFLRVCLCVCTRDNNT